MFQEPLRSGRLCPRCPWAPNEVGLLKAAVWLTICKKDTLWLMLLTRPFGLYSACMCAHKPSLFFFQVYPWVSLPTATEYLILGILMLHLSIVPFAVFRAPSKNQQAKLGCSDTHSQGQYSVLLEIAVWMLAADFFSKQQLGLNVENYTVALVKALKKKVTELGISNL